jgi:beta-lactam-binding protein with PASTA domain
VRTVEDNEITQEHEVAGAPAPGPPPAPPGPLADLGPWLAVFGIAVLAGLFVWFFVVQHREGDRAVVPAVVGEPQQRAVARLTGDGINVREIVGPSSRPKGIVVSQIPSGGSRIVNGQTLTLHVSNGRAAQQTTVTTATTTGRTTTTAAQQAAVPAVTGQDMAVASGQVEAAGFVAETDPVSGSGTPGTVSAQTPSASAQAPEGSLVRLSVVTGAARPASGVPNVVGQKAAAARAALLNAHLTVKTSYRRGPAKSIGVVLAESPTGSQPRYTQITLTVGS